ncbi:MAG: hypothetical protein AB1442_08260 [Nitrospirota bacterium]
MEEKTLSLFLKVRESFGEIKEKVSLIKPYFELLCFSTGWALTIDECKRLLGFTPEFVYKSSEEVYAICVLYRIDDEITTGVIAHEFAEVLARERNVEDHAVIDAICVERGYGDQLLRSLQDDILSGMVEREFVDRVDIGARIENLRRLLKR